MSIRLCMILVSLPFISPTTIVAQAPKFINGYSITGRIAGLVDGGKVLVALLDYDSVGWTRKIIDSVPVKNGMFQINGCVPEGPRRYDLFLPYPNSPAVDLFIDNGEEIKISCNDPNSLKHSILSHHVTVEGSPTHYALAALKSGDEIYYRAQHALIDELKKIKDSLGFNSLAVGEVIARRNLMNQILYDYLFRNPEPDYIPGILALSDGALWELSGHATFWMHVYNNLDEHLKNSFHGKRLSQKIKLCVGQSFPAFKLPTVSGTFLSSDSVIASNRLTLVQFWSSESYDRINMQAEVMALYSKYKNKGLEVIGVSSETSQNKWKLSASTLPWLNVSDSKGIFGDVHAVYQEYVRHPTTNVLVDADGRIVAWDVVGSELQWYLWKYLGD